MHRSLICLIGLGLAAGVASAQPKAAADQSRNWDAFMKLYPKRALAAGEQGLVGFSLTLDRMGHPTECGITHSSGHKLLDDETCNLLMLHAVFEPPKDSSGRPMNLFRTTGVINWRIPGRETGPTTAVRVAAVEPIERKICKRSVRTGTLAGFERTCMTVREWDTIRRQNIDDLEEVRKQGFTAGKN